MRSIEGCLQYFRENNCIIKIYVNCVEFQDGKYGRQPNKVFYVKDFTVALNRLILRHQIRNLQWEAKSYKVVQRVNDSR